MYKSDKLVETGLLCNKMSRSAKKYTAFYHWFLCIIICGFISDNKRTINMKKVCKLLVPTFSFCMFCYQTQIAIQKWIYPPIVDSTDVYNIADAQIPVITICAKNQGSSWLKAELSLHGKIRV